MEVLSIDVVHHVWLLVEFLAIEVFNSNTNLSSLLNMESVCHKSKIWVEKSHKVRDLKLELVSWVEKELNPSLSSFSFNVVLDRSSDLSFTEECPVDHLV